MRVAKRMAAPLILPVGSEAVSDKRSSEAGQNAYLIHCGLASTLVISVMSVSLGSSYMYPAASAGDSESRFVGAKDGGLADSSLYPLLASDELSRADAARTLDSRWRKGAAEEVSQSLRSAGYRYKLVKMKVDSSGQASRPILHRCSNSMREAGPGRNVARRAASGPNPVLCDFHSTIRDVEDLAPWTGYVVCSSGVFQRCSTAGASLGPVDTNLVRLCNLQ
jgi:hypothetical protein